MRRGTKIGWLLVAVSIVLSVWVIVGGSSDANQTVDNDFIVSDDGTQLIQYIGDGGSVHIPDGIVSIDAGVFGDSTSASQSITDVTMPDTVTTLGSGVFQGCQQMQSIGLSSNLTAIPANTFRECASLESITIPATVTSIGSNAFYGCVSLSSVNIPAGCSSVSLDAFDECTELVALSVGAGNSYYSSVDGCLYNISGTRLLLVPKGKTSVDISPQATTIGQGAFTGCSYMTSLSVPSGITTIEADAFSGSGIATITIASSVTSIGNQSSWTPGTIYGYADTAAETYAKDHSIPFIVVGNSGNGGSDDGSGDAGNGDGSGAGGSDAGSGSGAGDGAGTNGGDGTGVPGTGTDSTGAGTAGDGATAGNGTAGTQVHEKDATPTTADGIDERYFLCLAIFLGGVGVILFSRKNKMVILQKKNEERK